jgi:putative methyltransferase (TIGR04325 family)
VARELAPPILVKLARGARTRLRARRGGRALPDEAEPPAQPPEWEYVPEGFARKGGVEEGGWAVEAVAEAYARKWPAFEAAIEGPGPLGVHHEVPEGAEMSREDPTAHQLVVSFLWILARTARGRERVSVLDWGGGTGHFARFARAGLPEVELDYHCREMPAICAAGRRVAPEITFHEDDRCLDRSYDLVMASGSLQYAEDWPAMLAALGRSTSDWLYVTRLPVVRESPPYVVLQRAHAYGYDTEYLGWVLNRGGLLEAAAGAGLELERELVTGVRLRIPGAPEEQIEHRGFLFRGGPGES